MDVELRAFVEEVYGEPTDESLRLVLGDFLEEREDPRGELIRTQLTRSSLAHYEPEQLTLRHRELELLRLCSCFGELPDGMKPLASRAGFYDRVSCSVADFLKSHRQLIGRTAVRRLRLTGRAVRLEKLAKCESLSAITDLTLQLDQAPASELMRVIASPFLCNLERFEVRSLANDTSLVETIALKTSVGGLSELGVEFRPYQQSADLLVARLTQSNLSQLKRLSVNSASSETLNLLATCDSLRLSHLSVHGNVTADAVRNLQQPSSACDGLESLSVTGRIVGDEPFRLNSAHSRLSELRCNSGLTNQDLSDILAFYPNLRCLELSGNQIDTAGVQALVGHQLLGRLAKLDLSSNQIDADGIEAIAMSDLFDVQHTQLFLADNVLTNDDVFEIRAAYGDGFGHIPKPQN